MNWLAGLLSLKPMCRWQAMAAFVYQETVTSGPAIAWPGNETCVRYLDGGGFEQEQGRRLLKKNLTNDNTGLVGHRRQLPLPRETSEWLSHRLGH